MSRLDRLIERYAEHIATPWPEGLSGIERVIFVVYPPADELKFRVYIDEFELRTRDAGHGWKLLDLTDAFPQWMAAQRYRDKYFRRPELLAGYPEGRLTEFTKHLVERTSAQIEQASANDVVAMAGVGALFGVSSVSTVVDQAASGKLGSGAGNNVRLALLGIVFKSAGLPEKYNQARLVIWLKREGILAAVEAALAQNGTSLERELPELFVSDDLHAALLAAKPELAPDALHVGDRLIAQYPEVQDVSNDEMIRAVKDALTNDDGFPLTLIVLDEVQQFIGDSGDRAYSIQEVVESCSKHFGGRLLFVGTGQTAMSGTPSLQKIKGRFTVPVQLSDTDVEAVIRKIILQKTQGAVPAIQKALTDNLGEVSRHLRGTKLEHTTEDEQIMVADYPLLPVRRRFWEKVLHKLDESGTISQLRNQLRIVHEAACATAEQPLGQVVSGDFIYDQLRRLPETFIPDDAGLTFAF